MCTGKCSRCIGVTLIPLAGACLAANLLLFFPDFKLKYVQENDKLTPEILYLGGIVGGGILIFFPGLHIHATGSGGCCANRCGMFLSLIFAVLGAAGSIYCLVMSTLGLINGPTCLDVSGNWSRPFYYDSELTELNEDNYLFNPDTWDKCVEPKNVVVFNVALFGLQIAFSALEFILCTIQAINGFFGCLCGTCIKRKGRPV